MKLSSGTAHSIPTDLRNALTVDKVAVKAWEDITPLSRNEWICWAISVKTTEKRKEHISRVISELNAGIRRPCCWIGCTHRKDKKLSASQKFALTERTKR